MLRVLEWSRTYSLNPRLPPLEVTEKKLYLPALFVVVMRAGATDVKVNLGLWSLRGFIRPDQFVNVAGRKPFTGVGILHGRAQSPSQKTNEHVATSGIHHECHDGSLR